MNRRPPPSVVSDAYPSLPMQDGVSASTLFLPPGQWPTLLEFLDHRFPAVGRAQWLRRFEQGSVLAADGVACRSDAAYQPGQQIFYYRAIEQETPVPFHETILYQDEHLLVADKPHFLPVTPGGRFLAQTLLARLKRRTGLEHLVPVHRLDRETSGIVLFSVQPATRGAYQALFRERQVHKVYEALADPAPGLDFPLTRESRIQPADEFFRMREVPGPANSTTRIEVLQRGDREWRYRLFPITGKTHQLRVHMLGLGLPIRNDALYPVALPCGSDDWNKPLKLLARQISFVDPISKQRREFTSGRTL